MAAVAAVFTLALAAQILGEGGDRLWALADQIEPGGGIVWVGHKPHVPVVASQFLSL